MSDELEVVTDGNGIAVFGSPRAVESFLSDTNLEGHKLDVARLGKIVGAGAGAADIASKSLKESAEALAKNRAMAGPAADVMRAIAVGEKGKTKHIVQILRSSVGSTSGGLAGGVSMLTNPAVLGGIGAIMSQGAMQKQMDEITDYLASIDEKVGDVLRAQKDNILAKVDSVAMIYADAFNIRDKLEMLPETTWNTIQNGAQDIAHAQAYATSARRVGRQTGRPPKAWRNRRHCENYCRAGTRMADSLS